MCEGERSLAVNGRTAYNVRQVYGVDGRALFPGESLRVDHEDTVQRQSVSRRAQSVIRPRAQAGQRYFADAVTLAHVLDRDAHILDRRGRKNLVVGHPLA